MRLGTNMPNRVGLRRLHSEDVNILMFSNVGVQDLKSNSLNASAEVLPHVTHCAIVQEDR